MPLMVYTQIWVEGKGWCTLCDGEGRAFTAWRKYRELYAEDIAREMGDIALDVLYVYEVIAPNGRTVQMIPGDGVNFYAHH